MDRQDSGLLLIDLPEFLVAHLLNCLVDIDDCFLFCYARGEHVPISDAPVDNFADDRLALFEFGLGRPWLFQAPCESCENILDLL